MNVRRAASRATVMSVILVVLVVGVQGAVGALATAGSQPATAVETVPASVDAPAWDDAPTRTVTLSKQQMALPFGGGSTDSLDVQVALNETHVGFKLDWQDPTRDVSLDGPREYSDAAAVMLSTGEQPPITMGGTGTPVDIWYWRASWQFGSQNQSDGGDMYVYPHPADETKPGRAAGNPLSRPHYDTYAQNYYAKGFGSLSHAPVQNVRASGQRTDDGWSVVFVRERAPEGTYDAALNGSQNVYLAFGVWNGSAGEVNSQKSITLTFSTLDTGAGALSTPSGTGDGGTPGAGAPAGEQATAPGDTGLLGLIPNTTGNAMLALAIGLVLIWAVAFLGTWRESE